MKRRSVEFKDDFIPKYVKHADVLKLNKTLDDSVFDNDFNFSNSALEDNRVEKNFYHCDLFKKNNIPEICIEPNSPLSSSVLNYSAMNDSLIDSNVNVKENEIRLLAAKRVSMCIQKGIMEAESTLDNNHQLSVLQSRRCHSQGDKLSPKNFNCRQKSLSIMDTKRKFFKSDRSTISSIGSIEYDDQMNKAFLQEQCSTDNSVFLDLSNISEITRLNSLSSAYNSSLSFLSNGTMNQAFIRSASSSSPQILPTIIHSPMNSSKTVRSDISDIQSKFEALKIKLRKEFNSNTNEDQCKEEISNKENKLKISEKNDTREEKLIDVEVFIPSNESKSSKSKDSLSDSSSDSVFTVRMKSYVYAISV